MRIHTKIFIDTGHESWDSAEEEHELGSESSTGACRMDSEKGLFDALDKVIHEDFPNAQRIDCPGHEALLKLAEGAAHLDVTHLLAHIRECAPCFNELKQLRRQMSTTRDYSS